MIQLIKTKVYNKGELVMIKNIVIESGTKQMKYRGPY